MRYTATGRLHPERADINFSRIELQLESGGKAVLQCDSSQMTVLLDNPPVDGWISAYLMAEQLAHIVVGALGFSLGSGYSVELIQIIEEGGTPHVFGVRPTNASGQSLAVDPPGTIFNRAFQLACRDIFFRLALRDFLRAITDTADCATYCYRAIESLKCAFVFRTGKDRWDDIHSALGTDPESIMRTVKDYADPVRHGNWINARPTDNATRWRMLELTRDILISYLNYESPT
jgi:hypothetical protein